MSFFAGIAGESSPSQLGNPQDHPIAELSRIDAAEALILARTPGVAMAVNAKWGRFRAGLNGQSVPSLTGG